MATNVINASTALFMVIVLFPQSQDIPHDASRRNAYPVKIIPLHRCSDHARSLGTILLAGTNTACREKCTRHSSGFLPPRARGKPVQPPCLLPETRMPPV